MLCYNAPGAGARPPLGERHVRGPGARRRSSFSPPLLASDESILVPLSHAPGLVPRKRLRENVLRGAEIIGVDQSVKGGGAQYDNEYGCVTATGRRPPRLTGTPSHRVACPRRSGAPSFPARTSGAAIIAGLLQQMSSKAPELLARISAVSTKAATGRIPMISQRSFSDESVPSSAVSNTGVPWS
jgi:hypothetical protein